MLFDKNEISRLKNLVTEIPMYADALNSFKASIQDMDDSFADSFCKEYPVLVDRANNEGGAALTKWSKYSYKMNFRFLPLAFCGLMTDDLTCIQRTKKMLLVFCAGSPWLSQWRNQHPKKEADLSTGDMGAQISIVYTAIKEYMSADEQRFVEDALWNNAFMPIYNDWVNPLTRIHALDTMGHNWWMVCVAGAGLALLAAGQNRPGYADYLEQIINAIKEQFNYPGNILQNKHSNFGQDGDFIEYLSYLSYDLANFVAFAEALKKVTGRTPFEDLPQLKKICDFQIVNTQFDESDIGYKLSEFGDARDRLYGIDTYYIAAFANQFRHGAMLEYFHRTLKCMTTPYDMYFYPHDLQRMPLDGYPLSKVYNGTGFAVIRNGYGPRDMYFSMKTGISWAHSHRDAGTFVLSAAGRQFVVDSGRYTYIKPLYNEYYTTPQAHNVITKDGRGIHQHTEFHGTVSPGTFPVMLDTPDYRYLLAHCTPPYGDVYERFFRHVMFFDKYILMADDIRAYEDGNTEWLLHFEGKYTRNGNTAAIENDGEKLQITTLFPQDAKFEVHKGYRGEIRSENQEWVGYDGEYFTASAPLDDNLRTKYLTLFTLPGADNEEIVLFEDDTIKKVTIGDRTIILNLLADGTAMHSNSQLCHEDIETDAFLIYIHKDKIAMHNGSYLRVKGKTIYSSILKADIYTDSKTLTALVSANTFCYVEQGGQLKSYPLTAGKNEITFS